MNLGDTFVVLLILQKVEGVVKGLALFIVDVTTEIRILNTNILDSENKHLPGVTKIIFDVTGVVENKVQTRTNIVLLLVSEIVARLET